MSIQSNFNFWISSNDLSSVDKLFNLKLLLQNAQLNYYNQERRIKVLLLKDIVKNHFMFFIRLKLLSDINFLI